MTNRALGQTGVGIIMTVAVAVATPVAARADWIVETVDSVGNVGYDPSLAIDANGVPHIACWDYTNNDLIYTWWDSAYTGELNCSGCVGFDDINPFVLALSNPAGYQQAFPNCNILKADINDDGRVDFGDINPFVALLTNP